MMTFNASPTALGWAAALALAAAGALAALEWRRADRRHLRARLGATVLAVGLLALLGVHPAWRGQASDDTRQNVVAALWTPGGATPAGSGVSARYRIALIGVQTAPADTTFFPDAATLRRRHPEIATFEVFGTGLDAGNLEALRGQRVVFHPPSGDGLRAPALLFLDYPRTLPLGEPLSVQGTVGGLTPGAAATLTLQGPDGATAQINTAPADASGHAGFSLQATPAGAIGRFLWRLRLSSGTADPKTDAYSLGIAVVPPALPRVLVLESSPHFDTADLRHWYTLAGGSLLSRTAVGRDRYRFASSKADAPPEFATLDARQLADVDLVLADPAALAALTPPEREALLVAVTDAGLGVLTLPDDTTAPAATASPLAPWQLAPAADASAEDVEHLARPSWIGQSQPIGTALPTAPLAIVPLPGQTALIRDGQGRTLAAALSRGRGQLAVTLLRDSGRWLRANEPAAFSAYWSFLFSRLARPLGDGAWALAGGGNGPVFAGEPLTLVWSGAAPPELAARVVAASGAPEDDATLALARDPAEPNRWRATFWPRHAGWYRLSPPAGGPGAPLDFFVDDAGHWPALAAARRQAATVRLAQDSTTARAPAPWSTPRRGNAALPALCLFVLFVASAGFLWAERRLTG